MFTKQAQETYWGWCRNRWGGWYPCQRTRTVTRFCYRFTSYRVMSYAVTQKVTACEGSDKYEWWEPSWGIGNWTDSLCTQANPCERCYSSQKSKVGSC